MNGRGRVLKTRGASQPGAFQPTIRVDKIIRYTATAAAVEKVITSTNLGDTWLFASSAVAGFQMAEVVKLRAIEVWGGPPAALTPVTVSVDWTGNNVGAIGNDVRVSDTSIGATRVAHIRTSPSKTSQLSQWQNAAGGVTMFSLSCPAGSVIDLHLSFVLRDDGTAQALAAALVGATVGANYIRGFDGLATATSNFPPVSYPQQ